MRLQFVMAAFVVVAESVLVIALLVERRWRRRAERQIRHLGGRLLRAAEDERARIARELHDDISQQLALLALDIELLHTTPAEEVKWSVDEALARTNDLASSVRVLSQRLHPPRLQMIGLVGALMQIRDELSRHGLTVDFFHDGVPAALAPDIALCVYRIAQEALHNAVKHGRATRASMRVYVDGDVLSLSVVDDGAGFNAATVPGNGLGLISIQERVDLVGGSLNIRSIAGGGTSLFIAIPLPRTEQALAIGATVSAAVRHLGTRHL